MTAKPFGKLTFHESSWIDFILFIFLVMESKRRKTTVQAKCRGEMHVNSL